MLLKCYRSNKVDHRNWLRVLKDLLSKSSDTQQVVEIQSKITKVPWDVRSAKSRKSHQDLENDWSQLANKSVN